MSFVIVIVPPNQTLHPTLHPPPTHPLKKEGVTPRKNQLSDGEGAENLKQQAQNGCFAPTQRSWRHEDESENMQGMDYLFVTPPDGHTTLEAAYAWFILEGSTMTEKPMIAWTHENASH